VGDNANEVDQAPVAFAQDYVTRTTQTLANWNSMNGKQGGDPAKLADALVKLASQSEPPVRWVAGDDTVETLWVLILLSP
jgi:hypothetical protein